MNALKIWVAFGIGMTAGAAVALMFAPQSGERTRRQLKRRMKDATDGLQDTVEEIGSRVERSIHSGCKTAAETVKAGANWAVDQVVHAV